MWIYELDVELSSKTPVVGCEIDPDVRVCPVDRSAFPNNTDPADYTVEVTWYHHNRLWNDKELTSSEHPSKKHQRCQGEAAASPRQTSSGEDQTLGVVGSHGSWPPSGDCSTLEEGLLLDGTIVDREATSWLKVGSSRTYVPSGDDLGNILKLESVVRDRKDGKPLAPPSVIHTDRVISAPNPLSRRMIHIGNSGGTRNFSLKAWNSVAGTFSVLTYNVLADMCATKQAYSYCHAWSLVWEYRRKNLLREITEYDADILCLQEVESDHFQNFFKPEMVSRGYSVIYKRKKNAIFTRHGYVIDGCATFFRGDKFKEIVKYELEFDKLAHSMIEGLHLDQGTHARLLKDNVAIIVILEPVESEPVSDVLDCRFCVANTHIHANPDHTDVKLWQVATLVSGLQKIYESNIPILVCGDLNSLPGSAVHDLLVKRAVNRSHRELIEYCNDIFEHMELVHSIPLVSAYSSFLRTASSDSLSEKQREMMDPVSCEPHFTYFTRRFSGTLDYILYSDDRLSVNDLLELLDSESARKDTALPSPVWSSDHIALMASFSLTPNTKTVAQPLPEFPWPLRA